MKAPLISIDIAAQPPNEGTLAEQIDLALEQMLGQPITDLTTAKLEQTISSLMMDAFYRGEIPEASRPLAISIPRGHRYEIVDYPKTAKEAWSTWDALRERLPRHEADDVRDYLLRRLPEFYGRDRPNSPSEDHAPITREIFIAATGHEPINDDLNRCNCSRAGEFGHMGCGWDHERNLPRFWPR